MDDSQKSLKYLIQVEALAEEILADRSAVVFLDKRRNELREGARELGKSSARKCRIAVGQGFVECGSARALELVEADRARLDAEIEKLRDELKVKVNRLRDLECRPPVPGLMLAPLSQGESAALSGALKRR